MANTIMTAKNSFAEGLIMDFAPDNTQATCMTSALNATLLTFNGNEMSLQNDMGNGRVETARLPSGYIPVGTCEFGDIIYVVSYNPITDKSQIGCFPSPERNISSEEIGQLYQSISAGDFQTGVPGEIKATSVKKIIFEKNLNPGDKYIVYSSRELQFSRDRITDFGNTGHIYGGWPKIVQFHIVAIEDSGKINYLSSQTYDDVMAKSGAGTPGSSLKWYNNIVPTQPPGGEEGEEGGGDGGISSPEAPPPDLGNSIPVGGKPGGRAAAMFKSPRLMRMGASRAATEGSNDYYIQQVYDNNLGKPDLDSYRNLIDSAYQIFRSKVSGKLAIIAELEKISGFSCTHSVYSIDQGNGHKDFKVYLNTSWTSDHMDVNPSGFVVTESRWKDGGGNYTYSDYNGNRQSQTVWLPISAETSYLNDNFVFSSAYDLANPGTYEQYINNTCYKKQVELFESQFNSNDLNYMPRKVTQVLENNLPAYEGNKGKYYINAFQIGIDGTGKQYLYFVNNKGDEVRVQGNYIQSLNDTFIHNYFRKDITKHFYDLNGIINYNVDINNTKCYSDLTNLVHTYTICPAMPYGYLAEYAVTNSIDFSKVGSGLIDLNEWRYYNDGEISTLTFGIEAYPEENKGISKVELEFYDNKGKAAVLKLLNKKSYSGTFTEVFQFNSDSNRNLSGEGFTHRGDGPFVIPSENNPEYTQDLANMEEMVKKNIYLKGDIIEGQQTYYINDAGIIYPNLLYLVKINIYYQNKNALGEYDEDVTIKPISFTRWYWTNNMYNEYYYNSQDFQDLKVDLNLNLESAFEETNDLVINNNEFIVRNTLPESYTVEYPIPLQYLSLGYHLYKIDVEKSANSNLKMAIVPSLNEAYDTFSLNLEVYDYLRYKIWEGKSFIEVPDTIQQKTTNESEFIKYPNLLYPIVSKDEDGNIIENTTNEIPVGDESVQKDYDDWAKSLKDWFTLTITPNYGTQTGSTEYVNLKDEVCTTSDTYYDVSAKDINPENTNFKLLLKGEFYSKIMANSVKKQEIPCDIYRPFIKYEDDLAKYNIIKTVTTTVLNSATPRNGFSFEKVYSISLSDKYGYACCYYGATSTEGVISQYGEISDFGQTIYGPVAPKKDNVIISISDSMFANAVDIGPFGLLATVPKAGSNDHGTQGRVEKWKMNPTKDFERILTNIESSWFLYWGNSDELYRIQDGSDPEGFVFLDGNRKLFTFQLVGRDTTGRYIPFNAFARHQLNNDSAATQIFGRRVDSNNVSESSYTGGYSSFAHMFASFLSQLYYKSNLEYAKKIDIFEDMVMNIPYSEQWCKEFIVRPYVHNNNDINKMITILGIPFDEYIAGIESKYSISNNDWNSINKNNITVNPDTLLKQANLIQFVHTVNYDYQELLSKYELTQGRVIYVDQDITKSYGGTFVTEIPQGEILALDLEKNTLGSYLNTTAKVLNWKDDKMFWEDQTAERMHLSDLASRLTVKDEIATMKNIPVPNNIYKGSFSGDNTDEKLAAGFNSGIILNQYFKI